MFYVMPKGTNLKLSLRSPSRQGAYREACDMSHAQMIGPRKLDDLHTRKSFIRIN